MNHLTRQEQIAQAVKVLEIARKSPFYAKKYENLGEVKEQNDWRKVPMLSRNDLFENTYPSSKDMLTGPLENAIVSSTGGSTGVARTIVLSHTEWDTF